MLIFVFYVAKKDFNRQDSEKNYYQIHFVDFMTQPNVRLFLNVVIVFYSVEKRFYSVENLV